jgi:hypothetical protein
MGKYYDPNSGKWIRTRDIGRIQDSPNLRRQSYAGLKIDNEVEMRKQAAQQARLEAAELAKEEKAAEVKRTKEEAARKREADKAAKKAAADAKRKRA